MSDKDLNIRLTFIVELLEVINRIADTVDNKKLKHIIKKDFNKIIKEGRRLDKDYRKYIVEMNNYEDPEEQFDSECDYLYDLILATYGLKTEEKYIKAISSIKMLCK